MAIYLPTRAIRKMLLNRIKSGSGVFVGRMFARGPGHQDSKPGRVIPKTQKWYLIPPCLTLGIIRNRSRVKWTNQGKGKAPTPTPRYIWFSLVWFYGISTIECHLILNPFLYKETLRFQTIQLNISKVFVDTQLNVKTVLFQSIWSIISLNVRNSSISNNSVWHKYTV